MDSVVLITKRYKEKPMAKESQKLDELNTESTEEKTIQKDGDEQINDISTKDDEKIETVVTIFLDCLFFS